MTGRSGCPECNGRGVVMHHGRFAVCTCARITADQRQAQRKLYETEGHEYKSILQREREQQRGR